MQAASPSIPAPARALGDRPHIAVISDEPTPYRMHVLRRITRELPQVQLTSVFTHPKPSMPWDVDLDADIRPLTFPRWSLNNRSILSPVSLPLFLQIRRALEARGVRLVILLGYNNLTRLMLIHWAHATGVPLLLTGDSNVFDDSRHTYWFRGLKQLYIRHVVKHISGLMPMGTCGRAYYRLYANHNKPAFLFPYEPDYKSLAQCDAPAKQDFLRRHGLESGRRRFLYCGRLVAVKGVGTLLEAFARIVDQRPDWDLVIAGDGPLRAQLERSVPQRVRDRVKWLGFLQFEDLVCCYHCCDALVVPSEREPWALVVNEAVATGLPVVSTEVVGAAIELVHHGVNGLLVPPRNAVALADALVAISDADRNARFRRAAPSVLEHWRVCADPIEGVRQALKYFHITL